MAKALQIRSTPIEIQCASQEIRHLTQLWHQRKGMFRRFPLMEHITPHDLAPFADHLCVLDCAQPKSPRYTSAGSGFTATMGTDLTGSTLSAIHPAALRHAFARGLDETLRAGTPIARSISVAGDDTLMQLDQLMLPVSLSGVEVDFVLIYTNPVGWDAGLLSRRAVKAGDLSIKDHAA